MAINNFSRSLKLVRLSEGGNDDDPDDPGGRTSRGITQREYDAWREKHNLSKRDVWDADDSEVDEIYHDNYWLPQCDWMAAGVDYLFFDTCVNSGYREAAKIFQRALTLKDDGVIGPQTLDEIQKADPKKLIVKASYQRKQFYQTLKTFWKYGKGWLARVDRVKADALAMTQER